MKLAPLLGGFLLITLGGHVESNNFERWMEQLEAAAERRAQKAEAWAERFEAEVEARGKQFEAAAERRAQEAEARAKQIEAQAEAKEQQFEAELDEIRKKCAKKGFSDDTQGYFNQMVTYNTYSIDGFQHIYVQTYNPTTKKVSGSYYRINLNDPKAEPFCGKLNTEGTS